MLRVRIYRAGILAAFLFLLLLHGIDTRAAISVSKEENPKGHTEVNGQTDELLTEESETGQEDSSLLFENEEEKISLVQVEQALHTILEKGNSQLFLDYPLNDSFFLWIADTYGEKTITTLANRIQQEEATMDCWYEETGNSLHVLWMLYGKDMGFHTYQWQDTRWMTCKEEDVVSIDFTGDINLDEDWYTMKKAEELPEGIKDCIDENIRTELQNVDISVINNEFVLSDRGEPLEGKAYTFRANPNQVTLLEYFGADIASVANNHVYDYGKEGLADTISTLENVGISAIGAGENIEAAKRPQYVVANGRKIGFLSATEIEKFYKYTKEATETEDGVLKTLNPEIFVSAIKEAKAQCDYLILYVHWGIEGWNIFSTGQTDLAMQFVEAGADAVIGGHPHRMQGIEFIGNVPVVYSLGNFWFSTGTLYTTIARIEINNQGELSLRMIPCMQQNVTTRMLTDEAEAADFYMYLADVSKGIVIDKEGNIYDAAKGIEEEDCFISGNGYKEWENDRDLEGYSIDIVGNRN